MTEIDYEAEYNKAQLILGIVLQETGPVTIKRGTELPANAVLELDQNEDSMTLRLVTE